MVRRFWWGVGVLLSCAVEPDLGPNDDADAGLVDEGEKAATPLEEAALRAPARLEVYVVDAWGRPLLVDDSTTTRIALAGAAATVVPSPRTRVPLASGDLQIQVSSRDFRPLSVRLRYDGGHTPTSLRITAENDSTRNAIEIAHSQDGTRSVFHVYLGLGHRFFSSNGFPFHAGNGIRIFTNGEHAWEAVAGDLTRAQREVLLSTWWWESDFELVRPADRHAQMSEAQRRSNTVLEYLRRSPARSHILVNQFFNQDGSLSGLTSDAPLQAHAANPEDRIEMMGEANPARGIFSFAPAPRSFLFRVLDRYDTNGFNFPGQRMIPSLLQARQVNLTQWPIRLDLPVASTHQKFTVIDGRVAFVGGMNLRSSDWDTSAHAVFEPRRASFSTPNWQRNQIRDHIQVGSVGPRKDYMVRLEGPAVADVHEVFGQRWNALRQRGVRYWDATTPLSWIPRASPATGSQVQVTTTAPGADADHSIAETWIQAVREAQRFIYIEDQYFRAPMLVDEIVARMSTTPALQLVVLTKDVARATDPGCEWTAITTGQLTQAFGSRVHVFKLAAFDLEVYTPNESEEVLWNTAGDVMRARFEDIDIHAKMFIVDDRFMSVGSANKNNRGMVYEAELNLAIYDARFVTETRRRILAEILPAGTVVTDDNWIPALDAAARANEAVSGRWRARDHIFPPRRALPAELQPRGLVFPLGFPAPSACLLRGIGPDMT